MNEDAYIEDDAYGTNWHFMLGDSAQRMVEIESESVDMSIMSPPFESLYTYSASPRDMGNSLDRDDFFAQYGYIIRENLRIQKPGTECIVHVQQTTTTKTTHGVIGMTDFRGDVIRAYQREGWVYFGEKCIDKDPQALRHGQRVLTPTGWSTIESCKIGDEVIGSNGEMTRIIGVWPQGVGSVFRVTFSDGVTVDCDAAHKWNVRSLGCRRSDAWQTLTTAELMAYGLRSPSGRRRWEIPLVEPVQFEMSSEPLPLDPYVLGVLLGDGNVSQRSSVSMTTQRAIVDRVSDLVPAGHTIREQDGTQKGNDTATFHIGHPDWHRNDVLDALRVLGTQGTRAWEKRVPEQYMRATVSERRELLRGLLDTDGTVKINGAITYCTTSEGLALDVAEVVRSLGGVARIRCETARKYVYNGEDRNGRPAWLVSIALGGTPLVTLPEKVARWRSDRRQWHREIASIEPIGDDDRTCITVEAEDGLFVTEGYAVTHNSQAIRTKAHSLMFVTKNRDSSHSRPALADYGLIFKKPGERDRPVKTDITNEEWIELARPIWYGIQEGNTLNARIARESDDERHLTPLQLDFIEKFVRLYTNPGELVFTAFGGVGSELYVAVKHGRRALGIELKASYWRTGVEYLEDLERELAAPKITDHLAAGAS